MMSQPANTHRAFATTSPGLERVLADELIAAGMKQVHKGRAGCSFMTDRVGLERVTMSLTTAHRVLWTLGDVDAHDTDALYHSARAVVRWQGLVPAGKTFAVFATCRDTPAFRDARFAALRIKDAIVDSVRDATGHRPDVAPDDPDVLVRVSIAHGRGVLSLDAAGKTSLHARGYRVEAGDAPLRESLAAALPKLAGWDAKAALIDPMCGSGTIVIEAALSARNVAPGLLRKDFGFMRWPGFKATRYEQQVANFQDRVALDGPPLYGFDLDADLLDIARANAARANVAPVFAVGDATTLTPPTDGGFLVSNPPWGGRLGDSDATLDLLAALAAHWRNGNWRVAILVPDQEAARALKLREERIIPLEAGGRDVLLATGIL